MTKNIPLLVALIILSVCAHSQELRYTTRAIPNNSITVDGKDDEAVWDEVEWQGDFVQREPVGGIAPSQQTQFKVLYDHNAIYVLIRAFDTEPDKIDRRISRRDNLEGDFVGFAFDSYNDKRTGFAFVLTASGVKGDVMLLNDNDGMDDSWDPVWAGKTTIDSEGYLAEFQIPYSQIRFAKKDQHEWGFQPVRFIFRRQEFSAWKHIPVEDGVWVSAFPVLDGIKGIKPKRDIEVIPFAVAKVESLETEEGNPYLQGPTTGINAGIDGKVAVTNDLTLNYTINPDFGQVEADPSEVNLTAFETFFPEKRPFFIEGRNIYNYQFDERAGHWSMENLFYSRRIGRMPQYDPDLDDDEYMKFPENTSILTALKLSGKTKKGLSIGVLQSFTQKEFSEIDRNGEKEKLAVEPFTNYMLARVQKDLNDGQTQIGGMMTSTNRVIEDKHLEFLPNNAFTGGVDFKQYFKNRKFVLTAKGLFSHVSGTKESILELQESSVRYFQRPDAHYVNVDSNRTSLSGHAGNIDFAKVGGGHWRYNFRFRWKSPGLELNDVGFLRETDEQIFITNIEYVMFEPQGIFRNYEVELNHWMVWNFGGDHVHMGLNLEADGTFRNFWGAGTGMVRNFGEINASELRGGPALVRPGGWRSWLFGHTDNRKKLSLHAGIRGFKGDHDHRSSLGIGGGINYRPMNSLVISLEPEFEVGHDQLQYVDTYETSAGDRYLVAELDNEVFSVSIRFDLSLTPDLTVQYYGQPFVFSGKYTNIKRITDSRADNYEDRFHTFTDEEIFYDKETNEYLIQEAETGISYTLENPDFSFFEFNSNFVGRWEYRPGSYLYLVWSQYRGGDTDFAPIDVGEGYDRLFSKFPNNVFLVKLSYRFTL